MPLKQNKKTTPEPKGKETGKISSANEAVVSSSISTSRKSKETIRNMLQQWNFEILGYIISRIATDLFSH